MYKSRSLKGNLVRAIKASHYIDSNFHPALICGICLGALPLQVDNFLKSGI